MFLSWAGEEAGLGGGRAPAGFAFSVVEGDAGGGRAGFSRTRAVVGIPSIPLAFTRTIFPGPITAFPPFSIPISTFYITAVPRARDQQGVGTPQELQLHVCALWVPAEEALPLRSQPVCQWTATSPPSPLTNINDHSFHPSAGNTSLRNSYPYVYHRTSQSSHPIRSLARSLFSLSFLPSLALTFLPISGTRSCERFNNSFSSFLLSPSFGTVFGPRAGALPRNDFAGTILPHRCLIRLAKQR